MVNYMYDAADADARQRDLRARAEAHRRARGLPYRLRWRRLASDDDPAHRNS